VATHTERLAPDALLEPVGGAREDDLVGERTFDLGEKKSMRGRRPASSPRACMIGFRPRASAWGRAARRARRRGREAPDGLAARGERGGGPRRLRCACAPECSRDRGAVGLGDLAQDLAGGRIDDLQGA